MTNYDPPYDGLEPCDNCGVLTAESIRLQRELTRARAVIERLGLLYQAKHIVCRTAGAAEAFDEASKFLLASEFRPGVVEAGGTE